MADTKEMAHLELIKDVPYEDETRGIWITPMTGVYNDSSGPPVSWKTHPSKSSKNSTYVKGSTVNAAQVPCWVCVLAGVVLVVLILASVAGFFFSSKFQDGLIYHPNNTDFSVPADVPHESVYIRTKDGVRLNLILLRYTESASARNKSNPNLNSSSFSSASSTILYFHGNAGNIGHRVSHAMLMLVNLKANVVLVDYRGYGKSEGEPSEGGLYLDAEATLNYVMTRPDLNKTKLLVYGRSLGGAVAIHLASTNPHRVAAMMVENTFLSIPHMAATLFPSLPMRLLPLWYYRNQFLSYRQVALCRMPSLFVSGLSDQLIPPAMMKKLYELSPSQSKRLATFPKGTHMTTWQCQGYFPALQQFVRDLLKSHAREESVQSTAII